MEHTRKMVVVPQDLIENLRYNQKVKAGPTGKHILTVDREMQEILKQDDLAQEDKIRLYNNALMKFGDKKPVKQIEQIQEPMMDDDDDDDDNEWVEIIDRHFNISNRGKAKNVLDWIRTKSNITWNDKGEIRGQPGSNILTLLDDITRATPRDKKIEPVGMVAFTEKLRESNIPRYLISAFYQKYLNPSNNLTLQEEEEEKTPYSTPIRETPRRPRRLVSPNVNRVPTPTGIPATPPTTPEKEWLT